MTTSFYQILHMCKFARSEVTDYIIELYNQARYVLFVWNVKNSALTILLYHNTPKWQNEFLKRRLNNTLKNIMSYIQTLQWILIFVSAARKHLISIC